MTPAQIVAEARRIINDTRSPLRYSDADMLGFTNQILKRAAMYRPDLFLYMGDVATTPGTTVQRMPADSLRLVEILGVKDGNTVTEVNRETLDQTYPGWRAAPAGVPVNFMRHTRNPNVYFLYPRPSAGVVLLAEYSKTPRDYALADLVDAPNDAYFPALVDGVVYLAESVDDEHVNSGRAKMFFDTFTQGLGVALQSREVTDTEHAGMDPRKVG